MRKGSLITMVVLLAFLLAAGCSQPAAEPTKAPAPVAKPPATTSAPAKEAPAASGALAVVRASHQPALHALPTILGMKKGWFEKQGIQIDFKFFAAGAPQVEAGAAGGWDVGAMGTPPTIVGGLSYGQLMIGVSNDESVTNALVVRPDAESTWLKNPKQDVKGKTVLVSTISTGHYVLSQYLASLGLTDNDVKIVHMDQAGILTAFLAGQGDIAQVWAPWGYLHEEKGMKVLVGGNDVNAVVPGAINATPKFAKEKPDLLVKWLQVYMQGIDYMKSNPDDSAKFLDEYYKERGITLSQESLMKEFKLRPLFGVDDQVKMMARNGDQPSQVDKWMNDMSDFLFKMGSIKQKAVAKDYVTDEWMKKVQAAIKR